MNERETKFYKEIYKRIAVSDAEVNGQWEMLQTRLPIRQENNSRFVYRSAFLVSLLLLIVVGGTVGAAQAARPGDILYSVKVLSDRIVAKVTNKPQVMIEKRAEELIKEAKSEEHNGTTERIKEAAKEYENAIENTKKNVKGAQVRQEVHETIASQESKLKEVKTNNTNVEKVLKDTIEKTEKAKEAIKPTTPLEDKTNTNNQQQNNESKNKRGE